MPLNKAQTQMPYLLELLDIPSGGEFCVIFLGEFIERFC